TEQRTRVLVIDDHYAIREGMRSLLAGASDLELVGSAADASEGLRLARRNRPDVIVLDDEMPGGNGLELLPALLNEVPAARILMFSHDPSIRERSLELGAAAFVDKNSSIAAILAAMRPARAQPAAESEPAVGVPAYHPPRQLRHAAVVIGASLLLYAVLFLVLEDQVGAGAGAFSVLPVFASGALLGPEGGIAAALLTLLLTFSLWSVTGHVVGEPVLLIGAPGLGVVVLLLLGLGAGSMQLMGIRLDPRRRRVEAIAGAAQAMAGLDRDASVALLLDALLEVVPAGAALLYANAAGEPRFVLSSRGAGAVDADRGVAVGRDVMRESASRAVDELADADRPIASLRSAAFVPVSIPGEDVRGLLVLLDRRPGRFRDADLELMRPFAHYLWLVMRMAPFRAPAQVVRGAEPTAVKRA
ncbi:MAG TPA: response regulator, partial [Candidatus Limnocylindria bacterium]|nr:response regulator [Candidatus Limnocylindria bacterium]